MDKIDTKSELLRKVLADGLSEQGFLSLYQLGKLQKVSAGKRLFQEGDRDDTLFLVVRGKFKTHSEENGDFQENILFQEGDWIGELVFFQTPLRRATVTATAPSIVLVVEGKAFNALELETRTFILKKLNDHGARRLRLALRERNRQQDLNSYLTRYTHQLKQQSQSKYEHSEIIQTILKNIPKLPIYVTKLVQLLLSENASIKEIAQLAKEDPSIVSQILKTVNSPYYALRNKIADLNHAILYLGFNEVYQVVVAGGVQKTMPDTPDFQELHQHSVTISHLAFEICQHYNKQMSSTLSTIAVLHDIGKSVVLLLRKQNPKWTLFIEMLEPAKIGALLLREWKIPEMVCEAIEFQNYPEFSPPQTLSTQHKDCVVMLWLAHLCCDWLEGRPINPKAHPFLTDYLKVLKLDRTTLPEFFGQTILPSLQKKADTFPSHLRDMVLAMMADQPAW